MAKRMIRSEYAALGEIVRKYTGHELLPRPGGHVRLSRGGSRLGDRWGVSHSVAARIARGERPVSPETALRILRDIKPTEDDLQLFLRVTHLDGLLNEVAETLRHA